MYNCILGIVSVISKINLFFLILQHVMSGRMNNMKAKKKKRVAKEHSSKANAMLCEANNKKEAQQ